MKKFLALLGIVILVFGLAGCGNEIKDPLSDWVVATNQDVTDGFTDKTFKVSELQSADTKVTEDGRIVGTLYYATVDGFYGENEDGLTNDGYYVSLSVLNTAGETFELTLSDGTAKGPYDTVESASEGSVLIRVADVDADGKATKRGANTIKSGEKTLKLDYSEITLAPIGE